jgi:hypothetical protein
VPSHDIMSALGSEDPSQLDPDLAKVILIWSNKYKIEIILPHEAVAGLLELHRNNLDKTKCHQILMRNVEKLIFNSKKFGEEIIAQVNLNALFKVLYLL